MTVTALRNGSRAIQSFNSQTELTHADINELVQQTRYSWTIQTWRTESGKIRASFVGSKKRAISINYHQGLNSAAVHLKAAITFVQKLAGSNGAPHYALAAQASTEAGYVFTFID